jgi:hypothetical protein
MGAGHNPIIRKWKKYVKENHRWVIGIVITIIAIPLAAVAQNYFNRALTTSQYYYVPKALSKDQQNLPEAGCWSSIASNRNDAYRCSHASRIYDPCFTEISRSYVACPESPKGEERIFKLTLSQEVKNDNESAALIPWYVVLSNGRVCSFITGATATLIDGRLDYACSGDGDAYLVLPVEKDSDVLKIKCYEPSNRRVELCAIKEAWF